MGKRILLLQAHPDAAEPHFCHALAEAYAAGAGQAGHELRRVELAHLDVPLLRSKQDWEHGPLPPQLQPAQDAIAWCEHLVIVFPLWLGDMPALLKAFLEQVARPGFAFTRAEGELVGKKALGGRSARVVVTMGMPALLYRFYFRAHSVKSLERNILGFVGIAPVDETLIGGIEGLPDAGRQRWLGKLRALGRQAR